jgi:hypothetical protein
MACSRYDLYYGGTAGAGNGVLTVSYRNCGDRTPMTISVTGGLSGAYYGQVIASTDYDVPKLTTTVGYASAGGAPIAGMVFNVPVVPYATYVVSNAVSALSAHGLAYPTS